METRKQLLGRKMLKQIGAWKLLVDRCSRAQRRERATPITSPTRLRTTTRSRNQNQNRCQLASRKKATTRLPLIKHVSSKWTPLPTRSTFLGQYLERRTKI